MEANRQSQRSPDVGISTKILEEVRHLVLEVLGERGAFVYLFGSWARGQATSASDIDIAVEPRNPLPPGVLADLRERLEESHIPYRVEVVDLSRADPHLRERVLKEGIRWNA